MENNDGETQARVPLSASHMLTLSPSLAPSESFDSTEALGRWRLITAFCSSFVSFFPFLPVSLFFLYNHPFFFFILHLRHFIFTPLRFSFSYYPFLSLIFASHFLSCYSFCHYFQLFLAFFLSFIILLSFPFLFFCSFLHLSFLYFVPFLYFSFFSLLSVFIITFFLCFFFSFFSIFF